MIALVNKQMPRALGDAFIHVSKLTHVVEVDRPILELPQATEIGDVARSIGAHIAELIEDGSTLQMGIGEIPDAVLLFLKSKRHLGIHTEMFSDGVVELFESGVITNEAKTLHRGKIVASFVLGSQQDVRLHRQQPVLRVPPLGLRQRPVHHRPEREDGGDQLGARRRHHRPGVRRLDRPVDLLRLRRPGRLHPRRGPLEGRQADHRAAVDGQGRLPSRASWTRSPRAPAS